jgi:hypothetical protein
MSLYGGELLADFREYYSIDLLDVYRGSLPTAVVLELIGQLPQKSRTRGAMQGQNGEFIGWDYDRYLLVGIFDAIRGLQWIAANQNAKRRSQEPKPTPVPTKPVEKKNFLGSMFHKMLKEGSGGG